ncbi:MAG: cytochrome o ubiquinol oxidase subunit IV [Candidatus Doudnabacteria bacterium RIFCSPHIGHO2_01_FULL_45_18]|uniref:Cytochrome o ubiquinol oxidase subunit IV n=1 Tax=Candidatus Doudnabacteria bacterium RIFCSPHIGHO2_01_FULL_45_18 TaxID=1817823 RepID=A0A1F5NS36_9BACT|nr:MAG: cytochrome o ubiquinol oxidase subunit IV [Candidatus Doudnabacteria bacterium RIFCSPHIGHO2_01_FULL_45_18]
MHNYVTGFITSIVLTLTAYLLVVEHLLTGPVLVFVIISLALIQLWVQLIFFLHLDHEHGPKWNLAFLLSTISIILIVIIGTLWIMDNLSYHMPTNEEIMQEEGIYK